MTDHEVAEIEQGLTKEVDKRQGDRIARLENLIAQYKHHRGVGRSIRGVSRNYM